ncbi:hypothetical protein ACF0H5_022880 [Mactra antiquata]
MEMRIRLGSDFLRNKVRVVVMGAPDVGKTSFVDYFLRQNCIREYRLRNVDYPEAITRSKMVVEFLVADDTINPKVKQLSIKQAQAFILIYSVEDQSSFEYVSQLKDILQEIRGDKAPILVIGNKKDVRERQIHPVIADCVVTIDWELPHEVVSAKNGEHMKEVSKMLIDQLCKQDIINHIAPSSKSSMTTSPQYAKSRRLSLPLIQVNSDLLSVSQSLKRHSSVSRSKWTRVKTLFTGQKKQH